MLCPNQRRAHTVPPRCLKRAYAVLEGAGERRLPLRPFRDERHGISLLILQADVVALCKDRGVRRLALFGSAASGRFDPASSDLDFLVEFQPVRPSQHADNYFWTTRRPGAAFWCAG